jgi:hypothetical protein
LLLLAMLVAFALSVAGCSGINTSGSVSPASFFLPGIMKADPPKTGSPVSLSEPSKEFVLNN